MVRQSIPAGKEINEGQEVLITLDNKEIKKKKTNNEQLNTHSI